MENAKLNELEDILLKAKPIIIGEDLGITNVAMRFDIDLLKKSTVGENIIEFDNLAQVVDTFSNLSKGNWANDIESKIKSMSLDRRIRIDRKIVLRILLS